MYGTLSRTGASIDGVGTNSGFNYPQGLAVGRDNKMYVADSTGQRIRAIDSMTGAHPTAVPTRTVSLPKGDVVRYHN